MPRTPSHAATHDEVVLSRQYRPIGALASAAAAVLPRVRCSLLIGAGTLAALLFVVPVVPAGATPAPRWQLLTNHGPTNLPRAPAVPEQWTISISESPNAGKFRVFVEINGHERKTKPLPFDATREEVQTALEALTVEGEPLGTNVSVAGGPAAPNEEAWSYVVTLGGRFTGFNAESFEVEAIEPRRAEEKEVEARGKTVTAVQPTYEETSHGWRNTIVYQLMPTNVGAATAPGPITVTDKLPPGVTTEEVPVGEGWSCTPEGEGASEVLCNSTTAVPPGGSAAAIVIFAYADPAAISDGDELVNTATITGGGAARVVTTESALVSESPAAFGIRNFIAASFTDAGEPATAAGSHPYVATTDFFFNTVNHFNRAAEETEIISPGNVKDADVVLPEGFIGNPANRPRCTQAEFELGTRGEPGEVQHLGCVPDSQVGTAQVFDLSLGEAQPLKVPVYNLVPPTGIPAEFGFTFDSVPVRFDAHLVRLGDAYRVTVLSPAINEAFNLNGIALTLWGVPADPSHDAERYQKVNHQLTGESDSESPVKPFLTEPTSCVDEAAHVPATILSLDSWELPGPLDSEGLPALTEAGWLQAGAQAPTVTGCEKLVFQPGIGFQPLGQAAGTEVAAPSGFEFDLDVPQSEEATQLATPEVKDVVVTLPAGTTLSPSAANGLDACSDALIGLESIERGRCPEASLIGTLKITSALLEEEITGRLYLGAPACSPCSERDDQEGKLFRLLIEAEAPRAGVRLKLPGTVVTGTEATERAGGMSNGAIRATFANNPQLPFTTLKLRLKGGPRAPLVSPSICGSATASALLTPWSVEGSFAATTIPGDQPVETFSPPFPVSWDGAGEACPASLPFAPTLAAGTPDPRSGTYSDLITRFKRADDREQDLKGISVRLPPGLTGKIAGVARCSVPLEKLEREEAECPENSRIGTAKASAGPGSSPIVVSGPVYLAGPTKSARTGAQGPFGLEITVPAKAGPFDLGTVAVQAVIEVDPVTAALTVTSDPLPQSIDGVPFRIKQIEVDIDRPEFALNPTNCEPKTIEASLSGNAGGKLGEPALAITRKVPFTPTDCAAVPFGPTLTASTTGLTSKANGASLTVKIASRPGEANIRKVELQLPKALPSRLNTLNHACSEAQFQANPAGCPEAAFVGTATAVSPLLNTPLTGPAILESHGGAAFPDLVFLLQSEGISIELRGNTAIKNGLTYSKFEAVPDAPVSSFEASFPTGSHSILGAYGNLCAKTLTAPTTITSQNNRVLKQDTKVAVIGCPPAVKIASLSAHSRTLGVTFNITRPGSVRIAGRALRAKVANLSAGTHRVFVALSARGQLEVREHKRIAVNVSVTSAGQTGRATATTKA